MKEPEPERRYRDIFVMQDQIFALFAWQSRDCLVLPVFCDVPCDCKVTAVHYAFERGGFLLRLFHPTFEKIAEGEVVPVSRVRFNLFELRDKDAIAPSMKFSSPFPPEMREMKEEILDASLLPHFRPPGITSVSAQGFFAKMSNRRPAVVENVNEPPASEKKKVSWEFLGPPL